MASRQITDIIPSSVAYSQAIVVSSLPRGSIHLVQPARLSETVLKSYLRDIHREDRVAWQTILRNAVVRASDCWSREDFESSPYLHNLLAPLGHLYAVGIPLSAPVLAGYPGALVLFRGPDAHDFTDAEVARLRNTGRDIDAFLARTRRGSEADQRWAHPVPCRVFIFTRDARVVFPKRELGLDERVEQQLQQHARQALEYARRAQQYADRLLLPDSRGDLWVFHASIYRDFPALGGGAFVFFTLQPSSAEWVEVRAVDVAADGELVRLLPTLKFMRQEFHRNPTLEDISRRASLSPFHFHRRFTDLIGQTPKHFLLACQIEEAKRLLAARHHELSKIAVNCGFAHQSHFTSRFKQATGLTPTRWRRLAAQLSRGQ
jgi:AraC-like DNA-binding protein